ncbi:MAG: tRNA (N6-isopentenyl adenosine(37)-C2)-methylthiotransferase MiaB, partial [Zetaproteobacteria bacterium]|nr:tRNA (N6-isopentenyl adenosine(37)-C2)-methylthiotransferase MiaB [Zetaproteobacteria bacterium]
SYTPTESAEDADLVVLNTCHIREKAKHKVLSRLGRLKELKEKNRNLKVAVAGCVAQAEGKKLLEQSSAIDVLIGPGKIHELPNLLSTQAKVGGQPMATGFAKDLKQFDAERMSCQESAQQANPEGVEPALQGKNEVSRFVNIQVGCDNFCTFCVVPFTRGREMSIPPTEILTNTKKLLAQGAKEITLLGQNVNSYGKDLVRQARVAKTSDGPFVDLLREVAALPGLERLRFTTSNPHDMTAPLAQLFAQQPKLGAYYHLPLQSGSNKVLEEMRRKVTREQYLQRVEWLRHARPDIALSTDLIVGFPGESEEDFEQTLDLMRQVRFSFVFAFMYSKRKGTAAIRFRDQIPEEVKKARLQRLNQLQDKITLELNHQEIGQQREVLFLYPSNKEQHVYYGRTEHFRLVKVCSPRPLTGQLAHVEITHANKTALEGRLL